MKALRRLGAEKIIADFKPANAPLIKGVFAITPNLKEAHELSGMLGESDEVAADIARMLAERYNTSVIFKRSEYGMTILDKASGQLRHIPSFALEVFDVTGAGDTVIATAACMLAAGADLFEAAELANIAAAIVVGKEGIASVTLEEIEEFKHTPKK
jgi:rfaE bifunctional protein kinase chain/domain